MKKIFLSILNRSLDFLNRLEMKIFKSFTESYNPISSKVGMSTLIAAFASIIVIFILQMVNAPKEYAGIVLGVVFGAAFLYSARTVYKSIGNLSTTEHKIWLAVYALVLFAVCTFLFIWLAVWAVIIALVWFVGKLILKVVFPDASGSSIKSSGRARGDAPHCPHNNYPWCTFTGLNQECSLVNGSSTCKHGQF